jgi:hypothetical protein
MILVEEIGFNDALRQMAILLNVVLPWPIETCPPSGKMHESGAGG